MEYFINEKRNNPNKMNNKILSQLSSAIVTKIIPIYTVNLEDEEV